MGSNQAMGHIGSNQVMERIGFNHRLEEFDLHILVGPCLME